MACRHAAGINGAHSVCCGHSAAARTARHNSFVRTLVLVSRRAGYDVYTNGSSSNRFEYSFGTDQHGQPTQLRSDLVITDPRSGTRFCLDVTLTDPSAQINLRARPPSTTEGLKTLYEAHMKKYSDICKRHKITFAPMAFDTLGRAHTETARWIKTLFLSRPREVAAWSTSKVLRVFADGLLSASAECALRSSGAPTNDRRWFSRNRARSRAAGA